MIISIAITLPHPPASLSSNTRAHWRKKSKATRQCRLLAKLTALEALAGRPPPRWLKARVGVTWGAKGKRTPDPTNILASLKAYIDGLEDAGIVENDRGLWADRPVILQDCGVATVRFEITEEKK